MGWDFSSFCATLAKTAFHGSLAPTCLTLPAVFYPFLIPFLSFFLVVGWRGFFKPNVVCSSTGCFSGDVEDAIGDLPFFTLLQLFPPSFLVL